MITTMVLEERARLPSSSVGLEVEVGALCEAWRYVMSQEGFREVSAGRWDAEDNGLEQ